MDRKLLSSQQWDFDGNTFSLPLEAGTGRLDKLSFSDKLYLYRAEFRVEKPCIIQGASTEETMPKLLCSQLLLSGQYEMEGDDGKRHKSCARSAMLFRVRHPGTLFHFPAEQVIRHVGVAADFDWVLNSAGMAEKELLKAKLALPESGINLHAIRYQNRVRKMASEIFTASANGIMQSMVLESLTLGIYAELIKTFVQQQSDAGKDAPLWEAERFEELLNLVRADLSFPFRLEDLARKIGLSQYRLQSLFKVRQGCSFAEFLRRERLYQAKFLIENQGRAVKSAAFAVGYRHVSNFTLAYRQFFGQTPAQTQRQGDTSGG